MQQSFVFVAALIFVFTATVLISRKLIPILKSRKMGQKILEIGPRWHKGKEGTPTMGGLAFIFPSILVGTAGCVYISLTEGLHETLPMIFTLFFGISGGIIGVIDDRAKLMRKQNEGLTAPQKFLLQVLAAGLYLFGMAMVRRAGGDASLTEFYIPFVGKPVDFGIFYYVVALFLLVGVMNAVNLTDGIDGLCSSVTLLVGVFFALSAFLIKSALPDAARLLLGGILAGAAAGFLVYNFYPARVFMGDTGSLFFGGLIAGGAFMIGNPLLVLVFGFWYILETASVILQVGYFKLTHGKRLFKMAPIHHHFEQLGWSEVKIVVVASLVTAALSAISLAFGL